MYASTYYDAETSERGNVDMILLHPTSGAHRFASQPASSSPPLAFQPNFELAGSRTYGPLEKQNSRSAKRRNHVQRVGSSRADGKLAPASARRRGAATLWHAPSEQPHKFQFSLQPRVTKVGVPTGRL